MLTSQCIKKCCSFFSDIESKETDISSLVENLGFALISTDVELRAKATNLLSTVLANLPKELLNDVQLNFISTFYCDRIKDHHSVMPGVFTGMVALASMKNVPQGSTTLLLQSMFQHISCQSQVREDRVKIFTFLRIISERQSAGNFLFVVYMNHHCYNRIIFVLPCEHVQSISSTNSF